MSVPCRLAMIHSVPDYDHWAALVSEVRGHFPGLIRMTVHRSVDDPNEVMVELELESVDIARGLMQHPAFREVLDRAGVDFYPPVFLGQQVDDLSV